MKLLTVIALVGLVGAGTPANLSAAQQQQQRKQQHSYFGTLIGKLVARSNNVSGEVYAVDEQTLFIRQFNYDGLAPDTYFWSSTQSQVPSSAQGFIVPDEKGSTKPLERYQQRDLVLRLPEGKTLKEIQWLSVWSRTLAKSSGDILIAASGQHLVPPRPLEIAPFSSLAHGLRSGPITIVDAQTFLVPDLHYDGQGPAAFFWLTRGPHGLQASGLRLRDENGSGAPLRKYLGETVVVSLPDELTIYDFDFFGVWCKEFQVNFGQTKIPQMAKVPPSPKMLGIKPENKLNCEILFDDLGFELRWVLDGDDIVMQLVGKIEPNEYMAFGLGKDDSKGDMDGADAAVAWVDRKSGQVHAVDYHLGGKRQCDPGTVPANAPKGASCPDSRLPQGGDSLTLLHGAIVNGYSMVTFKRPQLGVDDLYDQHVYSDGQQSVLWAIGPLNPRREVGYHRLRSKPGLFIDFARNPQWNCPIPDLNATMPANPSSQQGESGGIGTPSTTTGQPPAAESSIHSLQVSRQANSEETTATATTKAPSYLQPWFVPAIVCPEERTLYAQIGPSGGRLRGYEALNGGRPSWGVAWYVNGLMAPELVLERGLSYTFVVEGGNDRSGSGRRHPLYLTDSQEGGFHFKPDEERLRERLFAGVGLRPDGQFVPTAEGRLCEWLQTNQTLEDPDQYASFAAFQRSLRLDCVPGQASSLKFTPDAQTPDLIHYQCFTHRNMGGRIRLVDSCAAYQQQEKQRPSLLPPNKHTRRAIRPAYERRSTSNGQQQQQRMSFMTDFQGFLANPGLPSGDEQHPVASIASSDLAQLPLSSDMLILNTSLLGQRQPLNLSSFDEVLKLAPGDLEFMDEPQSITGPQVPTLEAAFLQSPLGHIIPIALHNVSTNSNYNSKQKQSIQKPHQQQQQQRGLHSYMRRLASIYYPVQQQLSNMLQNNQVNNNQATLQQQPLTLTSNLISSSGTQQGEQSSGQQQASFSLSNLVPKPKIDLSKSSITKKLNKLRFKSNHQKEQQPTAASNTATSVKQPPTPAIEFNYDIFNNHLAELERQNRQFQNLDQLLQLNFAPNEQQQQPNFGYSALNLNSNQNPNSNPNSPTTNDQNLGESISLMQNLLASSSTLPTNHYHQPSQFNNRFNQQQQQVRPHHHPSDYLALLFNNRSSAMTQDLPKLASHLEPSWNHQQSNNQAVYVARLPPAVVLGSGNQIQYPPRPTIPIHSHYQQQQQQHHHWPYGDSNLIYGARDHHHKQSSSPSVTHVHTGGHHQQYHQQYPTSIQATKDQAESLSGSGSGAHFEFRPSKKVHELDGSASSTLKEQQEDHIVAMERFSKQPSERVAPSIVHPVTGEKVNNYTGNANGRVSYSPMTDQTSKTKIISISSGNDLLEADQTQAPMATAKSSTSDLHRLNSAASTSGGSGGAMLTAQSQGVTAAAAPVSVLVKPTVAPTTTQTSTSTLDPLISHSTGGPLVPSFGPPTTAAASPSARQAAGVTGTSFDLITAPETTNFRSTLVEPLTSNLLDYGNQQQQQLFKPTFGGLNGASYETTPFTPIELNPFAQQQPFHHQQNNIQRPSLKPSPLIESMMAQHLEASQSRPEPPVQVASYLAQQLIGHNPTLVASENSAASGGSMSLSVSMANNQSSTPSEQDGQVRTNELIVLKPAPVQQQGSNKYQQTYLLKPEYHTNQFKPSLSQQNLNRPGEHEHLYNYLGSSQQQTYDAAHQHQFERLSSLASPPSTSIHLAADPLQASHSITSVVEQQSSQQQYPHSANSSRFRPNQQDAVQQLHHHHRPKQIGQQPSGNNQQHQASMASDSMELPRDNNTDNAILSHVMSLIQSNAIPTPPLVPVASYSNAEDYFLPISDRFQRSIRG